MLFLSAEQTPFGRPRLRSREDDWVAGNTGAVDHLAFNKDAEQKQGICKRVSEFKSGESQTAILIVIVLGPKSVNGVGDLMQRCAKNSPATMSLHISQVRGKYGGGP